MKKKCNSKREQERTCLKNVEGEKNMRKEEVRKGEMKWGKVGN